MTYYRKREWGESGNTGISALLGCGSESRLHTLSGVFCVDFLISPCALRLSGVPCLMLSRINSRSPPHTH